MGRHSKPSSTKAFLKRTGAVAALAGVTAGGIVISGAGTANAAIPGQAGLVMCESGGNPTAVNNTAAGARAGRPAGLFQIVTGTWLANGGGQFAPTADRATPAEQQTVADRIYARQGSAPWECKTGSGPARFADFGGSGATAPSPAVSTTRTKSTSTVHSHSRSSRHSVSGHTYTVVAGDTLSKIARRYNVPGGWRHLRKVNSRTIHNPNLIHIGQKIVIG